MPATTSSDVQTSNTTSAVSSVQTSTLPDLETTAHNVIRGDYGNGNIRRQRLGNRYQEVQSRVNEIYKSR